MLFPRLQIHSFRRFLTLLAQFSGHQLNMSDMARALEVSVPTIKDYLDIIQGRLGSMKSEIIIAVENQQPQNTSLPGEELP